MTIAGFAVPSRIDLAGEAREVVGFVSMPRLRLIDEEAAAALRRRRVAGLLVLERGAGERTLVPLGEDGGVDPRCEVPEEGFAGIVPE